MVCLQGGARRGTNVRQVFRASKSGPKRPNFGKRLLPTLGFPSPMRTMCFIVSAFVIRILNKVAKAESIWEKLAALGGEEALAAELYLAELRVQTARFGEAVKAYEKALGNLEKPEDFQGTLVPATRIAATLEAGCQAAEKAGDLDNACRLAKVYSSIARRESGVLMVARMAEAKANASGDPEDFKAAGSAYEGASKALGAGPQESRLLWLAAKNLLSAKDYPHAEAVIEHFIALQPPTDGMSEAYYRLGEIAQAQEEATRSQRDSPRPDQNKPSKAEENWRKCYNLPGAFAGRAGVKLAVALQQRSKLSEAEEILQKNLDPTHTDEAQEESMFTLANIIYLRGSYTRASQLWERAFIVYPTSRFAFGALYQLGECYLRQADADIESRRADLTSIDRKKYQDSVLRSHGNLRQAVERFNKLTEDIQAKRAGGTRLTKFESDLLRHALFALADCRADQGHYEEARLIFGRLAADYQVRIDGVEALKRLYLTYIVPNPPDKEKAADAAPCAAWSCFSRLCPIRLSPASSKAVRELLSRSGLPTKR